MTKNQPELKACPEFDEWHYKAKYERMTITECMKMAFIAGMNTRPSPIIPEDAVTARYIEGCGTPPTAQDDVVVEPVKCPDPENCKANGNCTSSEPVTDDTLQDALAAAQSEIQYCHDELKGVTSHEIGYGGMTYKQLETLIKALDISLPTGDALREAVERVQDSVQIDNAYTVDAGYVDLIITHALKAQEKPVEASVEELITEKEDYMPFEGYKGESLIDAMRNVAAALYVIKNKYPHGLKITASPSDHKLVADAHRGNMKIEGGGR